MTITTHTINSKTEEDIRGIGLLWGVELVNEHFTYEREAEKIIYHCLQNGLRFKISQGNVLQFSPPLTITRTELDKSISILESAFNQLSTKALIGVLFYVLQILI